jgi:Flp pilus assembly protein TadG
MAICNFVRHRGGNVAIMFGLVAFPLIFLVGAGIDYATAARAQSKLNAAADAAALAAVNPRMMGKTSDDEKAAAKNMFMGQIPSIRGLTFAPSDPQVDVSAGPSGARTVTVTYTAYVPNAFGKIYHRDTTKISGGSSAGAAPAPNINWYMLLDTSPSMAIPATKKGIEKMEGLTKNKSKDNANCAFACHQTTPDWENSWGMDNYQLAKTNEIQLRIDNVQSAVQDLATTAKSAMSKNKAKYNMAIYTFDVAFKKISDLSSDLDAVNRAASRIQLLEVWSNNYLDWNNNNQDTDTDYDNAMNNIMAEMPDPGKGTNVPGDKPQEVLFFVTDGVEDEWVNNGRRQSTMGKTDPYNSDDDWCTKIKKRNIRIVVLYTTYYPLPNNRWYVDHIKSFQDDIGPTLQKCASSPDLFFEVSTDGDISAAMKKLFEKAVATAPHLTK